MYLRTLLIMHAYSRPPFGDVAHDACPLWNELTKSHLPHDVYANGMRLMLNSILVLWVSFFNFMNLLKKYVKLVCFLWTHWRDPFCLIIWFWNLIHFCRFVMIGAKVQKITIQLQQRTTYICTYHRYACVDVHACFSKTSNLPMDTIWQLIERMRPNKHKITKQNGNNCLFFQLEYD